MYDSYLYQLYIELLLLLSLFTLILSFHVKFSHIPHISLTYPWILKSQQQKCLFCTVLALRLTVFDWQSHKRQKYSSKTTKNVQIAVTYPDISLMIFTYLDKCGNFKLVIIHIPTKNQINFGKFKKMENNSIYDMYPIYYLVLCMQTILLSQR